MKRCLQMRSEKRWRVDEAERYWKAVPDGKRLCEGTERKLMLNEWREEAREMNTRSGSVLTRQAFCSQCLRRMGGSGISLETEGIWTGVFGMTSTRKWTAFCLLPRSRKPGGGSIVKSKKLGILQEKKRNSLSSDMTYLLSSGAVCTGIGPNDNKFPSVLEGHSSGVSLQIPLLCLLCLWRTPPSGFPMIACCLANSKQIFWSFCVLEITPFLASALLRATHVEHTNLAVHVGLGLTNMTDILRLICSMLGSAHIKPGDVRSCHYSWPQNYFFCLLTLTVVHLIWPWFCSDGVITERWRTFYSCDQRVVAWCTTGPEISWDFIFPEVVEGKYSSVTSSIPVLLPNSSWGHFYAREQLEKSFKINLFT